MRSSACVPKVAAVCLEVQASEVTLRRSQRSFSTHHLSTRNLVGFYDTSIPVCWVGGGVIESAESSNAVYCIGYVLESFFQAARTSALFRVLLFTKCLRCKKKREARFVSLLMAQTTSDDSLCRFEIPDL